MAATDRTADPTTRPRWLRGHRAGWYLGLVAVGVVAAAVAAAVTVWAALVHAERLVADRAAGAVAASVAERAADIASDLSAMDPVCADRSPFPLGGYVLVQGGQVVCATGVNADLVDGLDLPRGLSFPRRLPGQAMVVAPNGPYQAVAVVPAATMAPARNSGARWVLLGEPAAGVRPALVPTVMPRGLPPVTHSVPVDGGLAVGYAPLPAPWVPLLVLLVGAIPLLAVARARRAVCEPLRDLAADAPVDPVPRTACTEVVQLADRLEHSVVSRRALVLASEDAREEERRRLATELHDDAVQQLSAALLLMDVELADPLSLERAQDSVRNAATSLRRLAAGLFPSTLARAGFTRALDEALHDLGAEHLDTTFKLTVGDQKLLDSMVTGMIARMLYRNTMEAVRNAVNHGSPTKVVVSVGMSGPDAWVEVTDDGSGILPGTLEQAATAGHLGIPSMRTLLESVGGSLAIRSEPWAETTVRLSVPVVEAAG